MSIRDHSLEHNNRGHKCDFTLDYFKREHNCKTLLDIGAGKGLNCAWATSQHGYTATGIWVVFTWCTPGYGGYHHVNERSQSYWIEKFHANGFEFDSSVSELIKEKSQLRMIKDGSSKQVSKGYLKDWATVFKNPNLI